MKKRIFILGIIVGIILTSTIGYAAYKYQATEVRYTPSNSNFDVDNVSDAIKELYAKCVNNSSSTGILGTIEKSDNYLPNGYYKGTATDNNVIFGGYCWKIIRKNDDDDIRMLYNGLPTNGECTSTGEDTQIDASKFSTSYDVTDYNESTVKIVVDNWYNNNLATNYSEKISNIDLITREEASNANGGYLVSGQQYWTKTPTGNTASTSGSCNYNNCGGSGICNGSSNTIYIVGTTGTLELSNNGTYSTCSPSNKTCNGSCIGWQRWAANSYCAHCSYGSDSENIHGCNCCEYALLTDTCTAIPQGSSLGVRPVITLNNTVTLNGGQGTSTTPYYLN